jgi:hypothetical protein
VWLIGIAMLVILVVSALVVAYVAYPHRGKEMPQAPWLGDAMNKATDALPTLDEDEGTDPKR